MRSATEKIALLVGIVLVGWPLAALGDTHDICDLMYQGDFGAAKESIQRCLLDDQCTLDPDAADQLLQIIDEYNEIDQARLSSREAAYVEALVELAFFEEIADSNSPGQIPDILATIAGACEFADDVEKEQLLQDAFVSGVMQAAAANANALEDEGDWIGAYANYYYWLELLDPNCSVHAQGLLEEAAIVTAFADSLCETCEERYAGVGQNMLIRAVTYLNNNYVQGVRFDLLTAGALERCQLLPEALDSNDLGRELLPPDPALLDIWQEAIAILQDSVPAEPNRTNPFREADFRSVLEEVLAVNEVSLGLPESALVAQYAESALAELDPYTTMIWPKQVADIEKNTQNQFTGIGIEIDIRNGALTVINFVPDSPAYASALRVGDVIEKVDGVDTSGMTLNCAVQLISGPAGTDVTLTARRAAEDEPVDITITRASIVVPTVLGWQRTAEGPWSYMLDETLGVGYVRITSFSSDTPADLEEVLDAFEDGELKGLILDLRSNSGGSLSSCVAVADKFVSNGLIVRVESETGAAPVEMMAENSRTHPDFPLVILVDSGTASASEIVAGALADALHERAILVGQRTKGKGSVQAITSYPGGNSYLKYTSAHYYLPSGQPVLSQEAAQALGTSDWGIAPDVELELSSDEVARFRNVQRENGLLTQDGDPAWSPLTIEETLAEDVQLAVGLLIVRTKLVEAEY